MVEISIPPLLHDVLGTRQRVGVLVLIPAFGLAVVAVLAVAGPHLFVGLPLWRGIAAALLILDIAAGAIANFTPATNGFYAARPMNRRIFIAIHVHVIAIALLLGRDPVPAILLWAYAIAGASGVNALAGNRLQPLAGGLVLAAGLAGTALWAGDDPAMLAVMQLFLLKLVYAFAVDHFGDAGPVAA